MLLKHTGLCYSSDSPNMSEMSPVFDYLFSNTIVCIQKGKSNMFLFFVPCPLCSKFLSFPSKQ